MGISNSFAAASKLIEFMLFGQVIIVSLINYFVAKSLQISWNFVDNLFITGMVNTSDFIYHFIINRINFNIVGVIMESFKVHS
jgi:hypothetical protein